MNEDLGTRDEVQLGRVIKQKLGTDYYILDKFPANARPFYAMNDPNDPTVTNSFDIFCREDFKKVLREKKCDKNVRAYASYLKRVVDQTDEEDDVADNSNAAGKVKRKAKQKKTQTRKRVTLSTTKGPRRKSPRGC